MSSAFARELEKVLTQWMGTHVSTSDGHLIHPVGTSTARVGIPGFTYVGEFVALPE